MPFAAVRVHRLRERTRALEGRGGEVRDALAQKQAHRGVGVHGARPERAVVGAPAHLGGVRGPRLDVAEQTLEVVHVAQTSARLHQHVRQVRGRRVAQKRVTLREPLLEEGLALDLSLGARSRARLETGRTGDARLGRRLEVRGRGEGLGGGCAVRLRDPVERRVERAHARLAPALRRGRLPHQHQRQETPIALAQVAHARGGGLAHAQLGCFRVQGAGRAEVPRERAQSHPVRRGGRHRDREGTHPGPGSRAAVLCRPRTAVLVF